MKLSDWLDEYRSLSTDSVQRTEAAPADDWAEEDLLAPVDRVRDTTPRWRDRAARVGYGRATQL